MVPSRSFFLADSTWLTIADAQKLFGEPKRISRCAKTVLDCMLRIEQVVLYRFKVGYVKKRSDPQYVTHRYKPDGKAPWVPANNSCIFTKQSEEMGWEEGQDDQGLLPSHDLDLYSDHGPLTLTLNLDTCNNLLFPSLFPNIYNLFLWVSWDFCSSSTQTPLPPPTHFHNHFHNHWFYVSKLYCLFYSLKQWCKNDRKNMNPLAFPILS